MRALKERAPRALALAILFPLWIATAQAQTLYVSPAGTDSNDGLSWTHALKSLSAAVSKAVVNDQVWVAAGTYTENVSALTGGVSIYGGFAGTETTLSQRVFKSNKTQINGSILLSTPFSDPPSAVDGFTVQNPAGSGISCLGNGRIANNTLMICAGGSTGGGLFLRQGAPVVLNNLIYGNTGNGVYSNGLMPNTLVAGNLIFNNSASGWRDVGSQGVVFINKTIAGNGAGNGTLNPGIYGSFSTNFLVVNNIVSNNNGYEIYSSSGSGWILRNNCVFHSGAGSAYGFVTPGTGDILQSPLFAKFPALSPSDLQLLATSPAINKGSTADVIGNKLPGYDATGNPRIIGDLVDIGALEYLPPGVLSVATPLLSLPAGTYSSSQTLTITCATSGAKMYFTTDGTIPTRSSTLYTTPLSIDRSETISVKAYAGTTNESSVVTASYVVPRTVYVSTAGSDTNDGLSWNKALRSVATALTRVESGDQIWIAAGTYTENVGISIGGISILGGFAGTESSLSQRVLSQNKTQINGYFAMATPMTDPSSSVDGFAVKNPTGSGIYCNGNGRIANNTIINAASGSSAGGLFLRRGAPVVINNFIYNNSGNGVYSLLLLPGTLVAGNVIFNNAAIGWRDSSSASIVFINNTIVGNGSGSPSNPGVFSDTGTTFTLVNNIVSNNAGAEISGPAGSAWTLRNNCVFHSGTGSAYSGVLAGATDIQELPAFVHSPAVTPADLQLTASSPAIDKGNTVDTVAYNLPPLDAAGNPRVINGIVEIGAFEFVNVVTKQNQTISFSALANKTWGAPPFSLSATATSGLPGSFSIVSGPATFSGGMVTLSGAGTVIVRASQSGNAGYNAAPTVDQPFTVTKAPLTIKANDASKIFGAALPAFSSTYTGFVNGDTTTVLSPPVTLTTSATAASSVGTYPITPSGAGAANYSIDYVAGTLTITKATPAITWANPADIAAGTALGATQLNASANVPGSFVYSPAPGTVLAIGLGQSLNVNFTPTSTTNYNSASKTVFINVFDPTRQAQSINFGALGNRTYGDTPFALTATTTSGLAVSFVITSGPATVVGNTLTIIGAGIVSVQATQAGNDTYRAATPVTQNFQVLPHALTVTVNNVTRVYGSANPAFSASYAGFVGNDAPGSLSGTLSFTTLAATNSKPGTYSVTLSGLTAINYAITFVAGTLTITPAPAATLSGPVIVSPATANPNPAAAGTVVMLSVAAADSGNGALVCSWNFGDGFTGIGATVTHAYMATGTFTASVTVADLAGTSVSANINVQVDAATFVISGSGSNGSSGMLLDSNGDGIPDDMQSAAALVGVVALPPPLPINAVKLSIKVNFQKTGNDSISLSGAFSAPTATKLNGLPVIVDVGGVVKTFTLDSKGKAKSGSASIAIAPGKGKSAGSRFSVKSKGAFAATLSSAGLLDSNSTSKPSSIPVVLIFVERLWGIAQTQLYSAKTGKNGISKNP